MNVYDLADEARAQVRAAQTTALTRGGKADWHLHRMLPIGGLRRYVAALALSTGRSPPRFRTKGELARWMIADCTSSAEGQKP
jgi:hypothetical protein